MVARCRRRCSKRWTRTEVRTSVAQHGQSGLARSSPVRPLTAPEAHPPAQGCPLGPRGEPSPRGCRGEPAAALWCLPKVVAHSAAFDHLGREELQHGQSAALAAPQLGSCASSGRALRLWAARHSQEEAGPLIAQPPPRLLE
eukprot:scaffold32534_cov49-Phaeocystis_antarctica.AAC.1